MECLGHTCTRIASFSSGGYRLMSPGISPWHFAQLPPKVRVRYGGIGLHFNPENGHVPSTLTPTPTPTPAAI